MSGFLDDVRSVLRWRPPIADVVLSVVLGVGGVVESLLNSALSPKAAFVAMAVVSCAVLAWRRRAALAVVVIVTVVQEPTALLAPAAQIFYVFLLAFVGQFSLGAYATPRRAFAGAAFLLGVFVVSGLTDGTHRPLSDYISVTAMFAGAFAAGWVLRRSLHKADDLAARTRELEGQQEQRALEAVAEERARIARELHDVIAHSVSVMVIQAGAAEQLLDTDPHRAVGPLVAVQETGRQAVAELGRLLGMVRALGPDRSLDPQPGLRALDGLLDEVRAAGLEVTRTITGKPRELSPGLELAAFRIVQEALTNTRKHAHATHAALTLTYSAEALSVEVVDNGTSSERRRDGHGLLGMRERVALYSGTLTAEPCSPNGFRVSARFPVDGLPR